MPDTFFLFRGEGAPRINVDFLYLDMFPETANNPDFDFFCAMDSCFLGLGPGPVCTASRTVLAVLLYWLRGMPECQNFGYLRRSYNTASLNSQNPSIFTA